MQAQDTPQLHAEYAEEFRPRLTVEEAKSVPVAGWNLQCSGCGLHGALWRYFEQNRGRKNVALCAPCADLAIAEERRHSKAMSNLTGGKVS